jgi:hypothetical protein
MLVDTENLVTADRFRSNFDQFVTAAQQGNGPVAITRDSEVIGVFLSPEEYQAAFGVNVKKLLKSRERGPTVDHEFVRKEAQKVINLRRKK